MKEKKVIGLVNLDSTRPGQFTNQWYHRLTAFTDQVSVAIQKARLYSDVQQLAITDVLTGVYNRRKLFELAEIEFGRAYRYRNPLSLVMFDIDHFKMFNDTYGHQAGDQILRIIAQHFQKTIRLTDIFGRYGGEEFLIVLPETGLKEALKTAERFRKEVEGIKIMVSDGPVGVTISLGVACLDRVRDLSLDMLIRRVDQRMYEAKRGGRNRVKGRERIRAQEIDRRSSMTDIKSAALEETTYDQSYDHTDERSRTDP